MPSAVSQFAGPTTGPPVRGFLHLPETPNGDGLVLTHGAGSDSRAKLLVAVAETFADSGMTVLRCDLPFRQNRPTGPPFPAMAVRDREGLRRAVEVMRQKIAGRVFLGGHSYGGRQATMLAAEAPELLFTRVCSASVTGQKLRDTNSMGTIDHRAKSPFTLGTFTTKRLGNSPVGAGRSKAGVRRDDDLPLVAPFA